MRKTAYELSSVTWGRMSDEALLERWESLNNLPDTLENLPEHELLYDLTKYMIAERGINPPPDCWYCENACSDETPCDKFVSAMGGKGDDNG